MVERMRYNPMNPIKLDRRRQYYIVLDTETATLPHSMNFDGEARKRIAIAKPLVYDLAWSIIDRTGKVYGSRSFLISEIFSVPSILTPVGIRFYIDKHLYFRRMDSGLFRSDPAFAFTLCFSF